MRFHQIIIQIIASACIVLSAAIDAPTASADLHLQPGDVHVMYETRSVAYYERFEYFPEFCRAWMQVW